MSDYEKHKALCEYLYKRGHIDLCTSLAVQLRLCEQDRWCEHDVTRLYAIGDRVYYCTPSFSGCVLQSCFDSNVKNSAYLYDQLLGKFSKRDRNLF